MEGKEEWSEGVREEGRPLTKEEVTLPGTIAPNCRVKITI